MASRELQHHQPSSGLSGSRDDTPSLLGLLSNTLVLYQVAPHLPFPSVVNLAATSRAFSSLLHDTPGVFRHLDLGQTKIKPLPQDEDAADDGLGNGSLTEDEVYSSHLRHVFSSLRRHNILQDVNTLVLDGLSVTAEFVNDILVDSSLRIRMLSIREVKNLNERKLMQTLRYACRSTRPDGTPRLKGLYYFGKKDDAALSIQTTPVMVSSRTNENGDQSPEPQLALRSISGDDWYSQKGRVISKRISDGWAETILDCREILNFDAVLCTSPNHQNSPMFGKMHNMPNSARGWRPWAVATYAVGGCASCGSAPEGFTVYGESPAADLPLLSPIPLHSSNIKSATRPIPKMNETDQKHKFAPRCAECISERYCHNCNQWWCEACYEVPRRDGQVPQNVQIVNNANGGTTYELTATVQPNLKTPKIKQSCWECEHNCLDCIAETQKLCQGCGGGYCIIHYEGSTQTLCDWCSWRPVARCRRIN